MNMKDLDALREAYYKAIDARNGEAYSVVGAFKAYLTIIKAYKENDILEEAIDSVIDGMERISKKYDAIDLAVQCARRDFDDCFNNEVMSASIKED